MQTTDPILVTKKIETVIQENALENPEGKHGSKMLILFWV